MKKLARLLVLFIVATVVAACAGPGPAAAPSKPPVRLLLGCCATASSAYMYHAANAKLINSKVPEVNITVVESGAAVENIKRMESDQFHLGLATANGTYEALHGLGPWKDKPQPWVRMLWVRIIMPTAYIVREDSGIKSLRELEGKEFNPGYRGSSTEPTTEEAFGVLGIKPKWYRGGLDDVVAAIKDRRIVGYAKNLSGLTMDASILDLMTFTPIRILAYSKEDAQKIQDKYGYYFFVDIPPGTYKADWNKEPIYTMGVASGVATRDSFPADLAYKIVKVTVEDLKPGGEGIQLTGTPAFKGVDFAKQTLEGSLVPLHEGAYKYYKELGLTIPDKLVPPEVKR